jgi:hypothetical protein
MIEDNLMLKQEMFRQGSVILLQNFISKIPGIYIKYTQYMHGICHTYTRCSDLSVLTGFKEAINVG